MLTEKRRSILEAEKKLLNDEILAKQKKLKEVNLKLKQDANPIITLTDHAIVRYMERKMGLDATKILEELSHKEIQAQIITLGGTGKFVTKDNLTFVLNKYKIVTVY